MSDGVAELGSPGRLEVREQVELAGVVRAVAGSPTERDDTERVPTPAQRTGGQVCRVDAVGRAADDARLPGDGEPLSLPAIDAPGSPEPRS
jgi:hypothetical protein